MTQLLFQQLQQNPDLFAGAAAAEHSNDICHHYQRLCQILGYLIAWTVCILLCGWSQDVVMEHWCVAMGANKIAAIKPSGVFAMTAAHMDRSCASHPEVALLRWKAHPMTAESDAGPPTPQKKKKKVSALLFSFTLKCHTWVRGEPKSWDSRCKASALPAAALRPLAERYRRRTPASSSDRQVTAWREQVETTHSGIVNERNHLPCKPRAKFHRRN